MSGPSFTPLIISDNTWFSFVWTDTSAYFLPEYDYRLTIGSVQLKTDPIISNNNRTLTFSPIMATEQGLQPVNVYGTNGTFIYNKTASATLNVNCFLKDTEILTSNGYEKIQNLKINDEIQTYKNGLKKIKFISKNLYKNDTSYNQIHKISNLKNQTKDLFITGGHSILVDFLNEEEKIKTKKYWTDYIKIEDKYLLLACVSNFEKIENNEVYELFHIVLENDDVQKQYGIYANGILTESMSEKVFSSNHVFVMIT